jgi:signal transduction histidine kinase
MRTEASTDRPAGAPIDVSDALASGLSESDLADLLRRFNDATTRLHATHEALTGEVARLRRELREANEALERSRRLAALGEMAAGIAHEVRNPLGSIGLYASMLEEDLRDRPEQASMASKIGDATRGLDRVVGDVLAFARPLQVKRAPLEIGQVVQRALDVCRAEQRRAGVEVEADLRDGGATIDADPALVQQALVNVLRNAIEAAGESARGDAPGLVRIEGESVRRLIDGRRRAMGAIRVADSGGGVDEEALQRMFNPFFTTRAAGTGLGLAIVHRIVDAHAGVVHAWNDEGGGGAVFELLLPLAGDGTEADRASQGGDR